MIQEKTVAKNSLYSLSSSVVQKILTLAYFVIVARAFGPEDQGRYSAALAFATLFSVFIDLGLSSALTREIARTPERASQFLGQMFLCRIALGIGVYGGMIGIASLAGYSSELVSMISIAGIVAVIDTITSSCWFLLRGFRNLLYESLGSIAAILGMMAGGIVFIVMGFPVIALVYAVLFGSVVNLCFCLTTIFVRARIPLALRPDWQTLRYLALVSLPFAGAAIFSRIYTFVDVTLLTRLSGDAAVGWYTAGNKLILALSVIPGALSASLYPALSSYFVSSKEKLASLTAKAIFFLLLIAAPLGAGIAVTAPEIVRFFYGSAYLPTVPALQVLGATVVFGFLTFPFGALLAAVNRQKMNTMIFGIAAAVNVASNVLLIPRYAALGSAIASALTMTTVVLCSVWVTRTVLSEHTKPLFWKSLRILFCTVVMATVLLAMKAAGITLLGVLLLVGVSVYGACALLMRVLTRKEIAEVYASCMKK